ncbi:MAG: lysophospholipid acyltransferase family protein [Actinomycetota bacterium]
MRRTIARLLLRVTGWRAVGEPPDDPKFVFIAAPHTSNWDLLYMVLVAQSLRLDISWLGKDSLFTGPTGPFLRWLGGIPVDRSRPNGMVETLREEFARNERLAVGIPPEGTRGRRDHWKSGFYRVALAAEVPIVCGYLDWSTKTGGFGTVVRPTGDAAADMDLVRAFYADKAGKFPDDVSDVRLRDEDD